MIVRMKKITILLSQRYTSVALTSLRKLGLLHIKHMQKPHADYITSLEHKISFVDKAQAILEDRKVKEESFEGKDISLSIKEIISLEGKKQELNARLGKLNEELSWYGDWGNVSYSMLNELNKSAVFIRLYMCSKAYFRKIQKDNLVYTLRRKKGSLYVAHLSGDPDSKLDLPEIEVPQHDLRTARRRIYSLRAELKKISSKLDEFSKYKKGIFEYKKELYKKMEFCQVRFGMKESEGISVLSGFCPQESVSRIEEVAKVQGWAFIAEEPKADKDTPTLIRNPKWVDIIKPIFNFMGTLPGYKEYDISFWFLLFFSIFFAMLIGDAGYGFLFLILTFLAQKKLKSNYKEPFFLMYILSITTIVWGAITGTWFGAEKIATLPFLNFLVIDKVNSFVVTNQNYMIYLCFLIGAVQLSIAHLVRAFRFMNSLVALSQVGWICILWAAFFIACQFVLNKPSSSMVLPLVVPGVILVLLFSYPQRNILKGILLSAGRLPLSAVSCFSDIVSYLRLFAVGYASVVLATTCNQMALASGVDSIVKGVIAAFILFFGHSINIILGLLAVVVHGIRLNMLEFSGHLEMEWAGKPYRPFKE